MFYSKSTGGFYDAAIHGDNIPTDAVEITIEEHVALMEGQSQDKQIVADENGYPVLVDPPLPSLDEAKTSALLFIDNLSGQARSKFLTVAPGQELTYLLKQSQAESFKAANFEGTVPNLVQAEADATNVTPKEACVSILLAAQSLSENLAEIEVVRRAGKIAVRAATSNEEVDVVRNDVSSRLL